MYNATLITLRLALKRTKSTRSNSTLNEYKHCKPGIKNCINQQVGSTVRSTKWEPDVKLLLRKLLRLAPVFDEKFNGLIRYILGITKLYQPLLWCI